MKKQILSLALIIFAFAGLNAQILTDNIDSYTVGAIGPQSDHWTTWSGTEGGAEDGIVTTDQAASPANSMYIGQASGQDVVLLLGDSTHGAYTASWNMLITDTATAYYNFQGSSTIGDDFILEVLFNSDAEHPGIVYFGNAATDSASYPMNQWFNITHNIDLDADLMTISFNGEAVYSGSYSGTTGNLSSVDFYSLGAANNYYIDDIMLDSYLSCPVPGALICDNFESYAEGVLGPQSTVWTTWDGIEGGAEDGVVSVDYANSGTQSMVIEEGGDQDVVLLLGNMSEGRFSLSWDVYMEDSINTGFYNFQGSEAIGTDFILQCYFNEEGASPGVASYDSVDVTYNYPIEEWFHVEHVIDLDNDVMSILFNGNIIAIDILYDGNLSSVDFFSIDDNNRMYIDDVVLVEMPSVELCTLGSGDLLCDNLDGYLSGSTTGQWADHWSTWSGTLGTSEDGIVSSDFAASGDNSLLIQEGQSQDVVLLLGDSATGTYTLSWKMFLPDSIATAYYNFQGSLTIGMDYVEQLYFNEGGTQPGVFTSDTGEPGTYPIAEWFDVRHEINLDLDLLDVYINDVLAFTGAYTGTGATGQGADSRLSSIDFFSIDNDNRYYIDDILLTNHPVGISELGTTSLTIFPNPNNGEFKILNDSKSGTYTINVIDLMGRTVYNETIRMTEGSVVTIELKDVTTGVYIVNLRSEDNSTNRVVKMIVK